MFNAKYVSFAVCTALIIAFVGHNASAQDGYYTEKPIYIPFPQPGKTGTMKNYGPVGIGINITLPNEMKINNVEKGSPAEATGKLKKGQIIESINGQTLKDIDPRVQLANILTEAEATDGLMKFQIKDVGQVVVKLPVLGRYSDTWPMDCPKSDKIVRNLADLLAKKEKPNWGAVLFLLSTGEEKDLEVVKRWMKDLDGVGAYPWFIGLQGRGVCEYYLRTGDKSVLPVIKKIAEDATKQIYNGGWSGRGKASFTYMGGGHMNAAGVHALAFLLLARQCGVEVDEHTLQSSLRYMYRFAGRGNVAYGDQEPEGGFRDNGKTGGLALAMSVAAKLKPNGEDSVYAKARDNSAMKSFYASSWFNRAHTGGGIGEIWHANAMQLMIDTKPNQYRSFMDERRWHFELSRRFDGSFGVHDGGRYDQTATQGSRAWGTYHALIYTAHRKKLQMFGAPPTPWCKTYPLPERPWGNAADDAFVSNEPAEHAPGQKQDLGGETIRTDASAAWMSRLGSATDEQLWINLHHPEYGLRVATMRHIARAGKADLVLRALKSADPRVREVGAEGIAGMFKGKPLAGNQITDEMWELIGKMVDDPDESWFGAMQAMKALKRADAKRVEPHADRLVHFLRHDDWWLSNAALNAVQKVATDPKHYRQVLPAVAEMASNMRSWRPSWSIGEFGKQMRSASPEAKQLALDLFAESYLAFSDTIVEPGGQVTPNQTEYLRGRAHTLLQSIPGSEVVLLKMPKLTSKWQKTRRDSDKYQPTGRFVNAPALIGKWTVVNKVKSIDGYKGDEDKKLRKPPYRAITFKARGKTDSGTRMWNGRILIDLARGEALEMSTELVNGEQYLFIEAGGFSESKPTDWHPGYFVLKKSQ
jgi:hypothetical protein